ncbi:MAG TPA: hypothetical protein VMZ92_15885 [Planctomycetota bacterium]|nr:hypothetical protein [Planctomycetota bacterium]
MRVGRPFNERLALLAVIACAACLAASAGAQGPGEAAKMPTIHPKHPRLLFRAEDVEALRRKCRQPLFAPIYAEMVRWADARIEAKDGIGDPATFGFLYQMTGDKKYAEEAKRRLLAFKGWAGDFYNSFYNIKATYDLIYDALTPKERADFAARILGMYTTSNTGWKYSTYGLHRMSIETPSVLAVWGDEGLDMEGVRKRFAGECEFIYTKWIPRGNIIADHWGGWHRSFECQCWPKYVPVFAEMWLNATGENLFENKFIRGQSAWYLYHLLPGFQKAGAYRLVPDSYSPFSTGPDLVNRIGSTLILGKHNNDGLAMWWWKQPITRDFLWGPTCAGFFKTLSMEGLPERYRDRVVGNGVARLILLYYDPDVEVLKPETFPEDAYHRGMGLVSTRSGWDDGAAFGWFHCGRLTAGKPDDLDSNGFFIWRNGYLAGDAWPPTKSAHTGYELDNYRRRTIAHNLITVYDPEEPLKHFWSQYALERYPERTDGKAESNDGGQLGQFMLKLDPALHPWKEEGGVNIYKANAFIKAWRTTPYYAYVLGDATRAYSPHKLSFFTRQFVFLKPDVFVVFDRVVSTKAEYRKTWHIHPMEKPEVEGNTFRWQAWLPGSKPQPVGQLIGWRLLPEEAEMKIIGGKGQECWINGKNYHTVRGDDVSNGRYKKQDEADWEHAWRIDVTPTKAAEEDIFLHVLQTFVGKPDPVAQVKRVETPQTVGAEIILGRDSWTVTFGRDGLPGGRIRLGRGAKIVLDEALPKEVEETYRHWKDDPRYRTWTTDARYRIIIPPDDMK